MPNYIHNVYPSTDRSIQRTLYKYRALNDEKSAVRLFEILSENHLYFSDPNDFNDPFETIKIIDIDKTFLNQNSIHPEILDHMYLKRLNGSRIICFCTSALNLPMWSYYGGGLNGVALGYDQTEILETIDKKYWKYIFDVDYSHSKIPSLREKIIAKIEIEQQIEVLNDTTNEYQIAIEKDRELALEINQTLFASKYQFFEHENEVRILLTPEYKCEKGEFTPPDEKQQHSANALKEVIFGENVDKSKINIIRKILEGRDIKYLKAVRHSTNFEITFEPLD